MWFTIPFALATSLGLAGVARQRPITWLTLPRGILRWRCRSYLTTASGGGLKLHITNSRSGGTQCCQADWLRARGSDSPQELALTLADAAQACGLAAALRVLRLVA